MAGLKKPSRKKDTTSPNVVLVIFLVIFILSNIILGVWLYYSAAEKDKLASDAKSAKKVSDASQSAVDLYRMLADDTRMAVLGSIALSEEEKKTVALYRKELLAPDGGKFKDEKNRDAYVKALTGFRTDLGFDDNSEVYKSSYKDEYAKALKELKKTKADLTVTAKDRDDARDEFKTLKEKQDAYFSEAIDKIKKGGDNYVGEVKKQAELLKVALEKNDALNQEFVTTQQTYEKQIKQLNKDKKELQELLQDRPKDRPEVASMARGEPNALIMDVSTGKPLWDEPVGEIVSVDMTSRQATINLGSAKGVRPELTFIVFASSKLAKRAEGLLRGTVEVIRVLGPSTSVVRITSLYDTEGNEIPLTELARGASLREADSAMREGFLLFNMFWGSRVAVAGYVNVSGSTSENPSEQMRQLNDFSHLLDRQGIAIDAYLDLTDGQVKGAITSQTRFLIRGDDPKISDKKSEVVDERAKALIDGAVGMQKTAVEKGLFVISSRNFATMIGYRRPAGLNQQERAEFRPALPAGGSLIPAVRIPAKAAPMEEEKKAPEEKAAEKKD
jgi:hypothetical protein